MRFIRKGGRVIPIGEKGANKLQDRKKLGEATLAGGTLAIAAGGVKALKGTQQAASGFKNAVQVSQQFGVKGGSNPLAQAAYQNAKSSARAGALKIHSANKLALAGMVAAAAGTALYASAARKLDKKRKK